MQHCFLLYWTQYCDMSHPITLHLRKAFRSILQALRRPAAHFLKSLFVSSALSPAIFDHEAKWRNAKALGIYRSCPKGLMGNTNKIWDLHKMRPPSWNETTIINWDHHNEMESLQHKIRDQHNEMRPQFWHQYRRIKIGLFYSLYSYFKC